MLATRCRNAWNLFNNGGLGVVVGGGQATAPVSAAWLAWCSDPYALAWAAAAIAFINLSQARRGAARGEA